MNKNDIFTQTYLSIITETWNRFTFDDLVKATALVTNNFQDQWISAKGPGEPTGRKVLAKMNDSAFKTYGNELKSLSSMTDNDDIDDRGPFADKNGSNHYNGGVGWDTKTIRNYWDTRAKNGDQFSSEMAQKIWSHTNDDPKPVLAVEVGQLAYGIWKACNSRMLKQEANKQSLNEQGIDLAKDYPVDSKVENLELKLTGFKSYYKAGYNRWSKGTTEHLIYAIDEKTGIKFKIKPGTKDSVGADLMKMFDKDYNNAAWDLSKVDPIKITVTGKVKNISPEYKTISLNYAYLTSPTTEWIDALQDKLVANEKERLENEKLRLDKIKNSSEQMEELYRNLSDEEKEKFEENYAKQIEKIKNGSMTDDEEVTYIHISEILKVKFGILKEIVRTFKDKPEEFEKWCNDLMNSKDYSLMTIVGHIDDAIKAGKY